MDLEQFARALPKAELHLHLEGSVAPRILQKLAYRNAVSLPAVAAIEDLFQFDNLTDFLDVYDLVARSMVDADDFHLVTYEALARVAKSGGRYVEFFFSPQAHRGVHIGTMLPGILRAMDDVETDLGLVSRLIPAINRELGVDRAFEFLDLVLPFRSDKVIGIGLDYDELPYPPTPFKPVYDRARKAGMRLTIHSGWDGPPGYVRDSLELLGVERIDHGYRTVEDPDLLAFCREANVPFTICPTSVTTLTGWRDLRSQTHPIRIMLDAGLNLVVNSDDPGLLKTDLATEYLVLAETMSVDRSTLAKLAMNSLEAAWLDESVKREWREIWLAEIDGLLTQTEEAPVGN